MTTLRPPPALGISALLAISNDESLNNFARAVCREAANAFSEVQAEIERLREDAERYRWLRSVSVYDGAKLPDRFWELLGDLLDEDFDAAIDAARREKP